jgi:hypothetical protein
MNKQELNDKDMTRMILDLTIGRYRCDTLDLYYKELTAGITIEP